MGHRQDPRESMLLSRVLSRAAQKSLLPGVPTWENPVRGQTCLFLTEPRAWRSAKRNPRD